MRNSAWWIGLAAAGSLAFGTSLALAQEGPDISVNVLQRVNSNPPTGAPAGSASAGEQAGNARGALTGSSSSSAAGPASASTSAETTTVTQDTTSGTATKQLAKGGGSPLEVAALGVILLAAGARRRFSRA